MSRTDRHKPWWVQINQSPLAYTEHDHLHFGETHYFRVAAKDDEGNPVFADRDIYLSADEVHRKYGLHWQVRSLPLDRQLAVLGQVREALTGNNPDPERQIFIKTVNEQVYERRPITTADHCTEGAPKTDFRASHGTHTENPCQLDVSWSERRKMFGRSPAARDFERAVQGGARAHATSSLKQMANAYNTYGDDEDWEDDFDSRDADLHDPKVPTGWWW